MDREKVVKGMRMCISQVECSPDDCPYYIRPNNESGLCWDRLMTDALAMLKEQTHGETFTVIDTKTGKEADEYDIALHEDWAKHLCYCDMEGWAIENDGTLLLVDECGRFAYADRERFKVVWDA